MSGDEIKPAVIKVLTTHKTDVELIVLHLQGKLKRSALSPKVQEKVDRMHKVSDWIRHYGSRLKVVPIIENDFGLSKSQALRLFNETMMVYSTTAEQVKSRHFHLDILLGEVTKGMRLSLTKNDFKSHSSYVKTYTEIILKLLGDDEASKYDKIQPVPVLIGFYPEMVMTGDHTEEDLLKAAREFRRKKKKAITAIDVEHEPAD